MLSIIESLPLWVLITIIILCIALIGLILLHGISISFKGVKLDTKTSQHNTQELEIPASHIIQFRKVRHDIKRYIENSKSEHLPVFKNIFTDYLKSLNYDSKGVDSFIQQALDIVYFPTLKETIIGNHFPTRAQDKQGNFTESLKKFERRFFKSYSFPTANSVLNMIENHIAGDRDPEEPSLIPAEKRKRFILSVASLIIKCRERRDYVFGQIHFQDDAAISLIKYEWEVTYG